MFAIEAPKDMDKKEVSVRLATRLKEARESQGLSLDSLSKLSGVSVSMISQIERAETNPTVVIILNLTSALKIDFAGLVEDELTEKSPIKSVMRAGQVPVIDGYGAGCKIRVISAPEEFGNTEIYDLTFTRKGKLESDPHRKGSVETLTVLEGSVNVSSAGVSETVSSGDTIRYAADTDHSIVANGQASRCILVVTGNM